MTNNIPESVYNRLGGVYNIAAVADDFIDFLKDLQSSLDKFQVPPAEQKELFAIVDSTKADIVMG